MPTLKKIPNWIINADKDLLKYKPVEKLVPEEPVISNDEEAKAKVTKVKEKKPTKKKVVIHEYSSDEEFYKPKKKKIPKKNSEFLLQLGNLQVRVKLIFNKLKVVEKMG